MTSETLFEEAKRVIPGGVNSPVRAFGRVGGTPRFIERGRGAYLWDADGRKYVDFVLSWGPLILGHCHPDVLEALMHQASLGTSYGAPTRLEVEMARMVCEAFPSMEKVRFVNSGTEALMSAVRLARAATGRDLVVKFDGCYHGHSDCLLVKAGSGVLAQGVPDCPGVPGAVVSSTVVLSYNDTQAFEEFMGEHGREVAAVVVEPVAGNMGVVPPERGFLESARDQTRRHGALLVFDEVITGFRFCYGGYQHISGITPDITCLGKIVGGGLPAAAFGAKAEIMNLLAPVGPVYQAGTLSGNPLAMAAGIATLRVLREQDPYRELARNMAVFANGIGQAAREAGIPVTVNVMGSMATVFFTRGPVRGLADVEAADTALYARFFHAMLDRGVYLAPSPYEALFVSTAHTPDIIDRALAAAHEAISSLSP
ncbi:MAG TPA: glutamate-1-semialdehyde 2,1-aminomutase [Deltaproteobacteria bacterium]|nr:glutamate-1-semialdehyde 2,1-aminomutase [Deltaproteobacteria bacterium]HOM29481.1 glutamate-1-semialdehyde 2,1-aminomutase [Deltaproteobacteria bacterium]HPP80115.1 glutamate-1-semialdehyde 2,1-aminomutase [Deltaproteobacteria bacterium]